MDTHEHSKRQADTISHLRRFVELVTFTVGEIPVTEATAALKAYLASLPAEKHALLVVDQIDQVAIRRRGGVWKSVAEVEQNLYGKDRSGDITGREKPGELGELLAVLALYGATPSVIDILNKYGDVPLPSLQALIAEMAEEADTDVHLHYSPDALPTEQLKLAIKATIKIADEVADLIYYAHYLRDPEEEAELIALAQALTGWNAEQLRMLAIAKYYIRNEYSDKMAKVNKKQDKKNRKAIEQAVLTHLLCEQQDMLLHFTLNKEVVPILKELSVQYRSSQKERVRFVPHAEVVLTDLAGTLVDTNALFVETYRVLAAAMGHEWAAEDQEELELQVRAARMKDPRASRQALFLAKITGTKPSEEEIEAFQIKRDKELERVFTTSPIALQPGVAELIAHQTHEGRKLIVVTGLEPKLVQLIKARIPALQTAALYCRGIHEDDATALLRALKSEGCEPQACTAIFDSAAHVLAALNAGVAQGHYPLFYVPSFQNIEAQALSLGHADTEEAKKVYEASSIEDIIAEWGHSSSI